MRKVLQIVALCLGTIAVSNGCVSDEKEDNEISQSVTQCGNNVCSGKTYCCNASCGICAPIGAFCTQQACRTAGGADDTAADETAAEDLVSTPDVESDLVLLQRCGPVLCPAGKVCCNESCGICTPPGGFCTQQFCGPIE